MTFLSQQIELNPHQEGPLLHLLGELRPALLHPAGDEGRGPRQEEADVDAGGGGVQLVHAGVVAQGEAEDLKKKLNWRKMRFFLQ